MGCHASYKRQLGECDSYFVADEQRYYLSVEYMVE